MYKRQLYDLYDLAHVAGWDPYNLHDLLTAHVSWAESVLLSADPPQPLTTAGEELDDLDYDLSDLSEACHSDSARSQL